MRANEIRDLTREEAAQKLQEFTEDLFRLRMRKGTGQIDNPMQLLKLRRDIARLKTIQHEQSRIQATHGTGK